jgi:hypothetical protein
MTDLSKENEMLLEGGERMSHKSKNTLIMLLLLVIAGLIIALILT